MITPVTISIRGAEGTEEKSYRGQFILKDGIHYLFYEGENGACRITVYPDRAEIRRDGEPLRELCIVEGECTEAVFCQSFGNLRFLVKGRKILTETSGDGHFYEFSYTLLQEDTVVSENTVRILTRP